MIDQKAREQKHRSREPLRVDIITMQFPVRPEAFAMSDISGILREGVRLRIHSLRTRHPETDALLREWKFASLPMSWSTLSTLLRMSLELLRAPGRTMGMIKRVLQATRGDRYHRLRGLASIPRTLEIVRDILSDRPDRVHLFWGHYPALAGLTLLEEAPDLPVTMFLGAYDLMWGYPLSMELARRAKAVITHSEENRPRLLREGVPEDNLHVIVRGVDFERYESLMDGENDPDRLIACGSLVPAKRMDRIIRLLATLHERGEDCRLVMIGEGPEESRLKRLSEELNLGRFVEFCGGVPHKEVFREMSRSGFAVLLTDKPSERLPNVIKEAMACGAIPVVTSSPGIQELVPSEKHGVVLHAARTWERLGNSYWEDEKKQLSGSEENELIEQAAEALVDLRKEPEARAWIREQARTHVREKFSLEKSAHSLVALWKKVS